MDKLNDNRELAEKVTGYFALFYEVVEDFLERRAPYRDDHLKLAHEAHVRGDLLLAGPLADPADGALLVFRGEEPAAAENFARHDPYVINGLVRNWYVRPWTVVVGNETPQPTAESAL
ncbi:MAG TPA: YciI-like protein [Candidatus Acidoferrales bacterium]|nr:YciI-like protein [Candidatus Acidoferrales bacterium]